MAVCYQSSSLPRRSRCLIPLLLMKLTFIFITGRKVCVCLYSAREWEVSGLVLLLFYSSHRFLSYWIYNLCVYGWTCKYVCLCTQTYIHKSMYYYSTVLMGLCSRFSIGWCLIEIISYAIPLLYLPLNKSTNEYIIFKTLFPEHSSILLLFHLAL